MLSKFINALFVLVALTPKVSATPFLCPAHLEPDSIEALAHALSEETLAAAWNSSGSLYDSTYSFEEGHVLRAIARMSVRDWRPGIYFVELNDYTSAPTVYRFLQTLTRQKVLRHAQETKRGTTIHFYAREEKSEVRRRIHEFYSKQLESTFKRPRKFKWEQATVLMDRIDGQSARWDLLMEQFNVPIGKLEALDFEILLQQLMRTPEVDLPRKGEAGWRELHPALEIKMIRQRIGALIDANLVKTKRQKVNGQDGQRIELRESFRDALENYFFGQESPARFAFEL